MNEKYAPEKLNLWDRFFNRYKRIPVREFTENWVRFYPGTYLEIPNSNYIRRVNVYHSVDRLTGGYEIFREYLND